MKTATRFGVEKSDSGIALTCYEGFENRRAWEAFRFPVHPKHDDARWAHDVDVQFTVVLPGPRPW